jgi:hypothetical protein
LLLRNFFVDSSIKFESVWKTTSKEFAPVVICQVSARNWHLRNPRISILSTKENEAFVKMVVAFVLLFVQPMRKQNSRENQGDEGVVIVRLCWNNKWGGAGCGSHATS